MTIESLWDSKKEQDWIAAENAYTTRVNPKNRQIEIELESTLRLVKVTDDVSRLQLGSDWYECLLKKYFRWKYTQANRFATTTKTFSDAYSQDHSRVDYLVGSILSEPEKEDSELMGFKASRIRGLGVAGASGLLSLLFPSLYGTVDQFVVENLERLVTLPEHDSIIRIREQAIQLRDFVLITDVYRTKSATLNRVFDSNKWTPRRIDRVLWATRE